MTDSSSFSLVVFFICCLVFTFSSVSERGSTLLEVPTVELTAVQFSSVFMAIVLGLGMLLVQLTIERMNGMREAAMRLPTFQWKLAEGQDYVCFLSHCMYAGLGSVVEDRILAMAAVHNC